MNIAEAAKAYMAAVCPANALVTPFNDALQGNDIEALHAIAQQSIPVESAAAKALDTGLWPESVRADIATVRDAYFSEVSTSNQIMQASSMSEVAQIAWPDKSTASTASARLRSRLNLGSDPTANCQ
jgi:hypothetical protein